MDPWKISIIYSYFGVMLILSIYGIHRYFLVYLYYRYKKGRPSPATRFSSFPRVTVQLPIYNEACVISRLIDAVCALDYPRDRLEIQVLDDSTDETVFIAESKVKEKREQGFDITYIHRQDRTGFKAGALKAGLSIAKSEFIAIFDADFIPQPGMLKKIIHYFIVF